MRYDGNYEMKQSSMSQHDPRKDTSHDEKQSPEASRRERSY
jgi:hypothetical protein